MNDNTREIIRNVKYWSDRLEETTAEIAPQRSKLHDPLQMTTLSIEEAYKLRDALGQYRAISKLLAEQVQITVNSDDYAKKSFFQKLFNK